MRPKAHILPTIILAQFACTSVWFAGNAVADQLADKTGLGNEIIGLVLSAVQLGFISGTLVFAVLMLSDRFAPAKVFLCCALLGATSNLVLVLQQLGTPELLLARFATGFFLAGIYPVGMKIAADYYESGLGKALGFLVGALVFGTAFPYLVKGMAWDASDSLVLQTTSLLSVVGGMGLWVLVPNGPFRKPSKKLQLGVGPSLFKYAGFRKAAVGYFGHMWELYTFWAFTPMAMASFQETHHLPIPIPFAVFVVIAAGGFSCIIGGMLSQRYGSHRVAVLSLASSGLFCFFSPLLFLCPPFLFFGLWCVWGMAVTADSPQFSALVAANAPAEHRGTALTLVNCIGFAISVLSLQLISYVLPAIDISYALMVLGIGPVMGLWQLSQKNR